MGLVSVAAYRDPAELAAALETDPIARARGHLLSAGVATATLDAIENAARDEVDTALAIADAAPWPEPAAAFTDVQTVGEGQWR